MGQWGQRKKFKNETAQVDCLCTVMGRDSFAPLRADGVIVGITTVNVLGDPPDVEALIAQVKQRFMGKRYDDWLAASDWLAL